MITVESCAEKKEGWQHENWRMPGLLAFTREAHSMPRSERGGTSGYDSLTELHYSPGSMESHVFWQSDKELQKGLTIGSETVDVLYDVNGIAIQVHGYINLDRGQGTDVYLRGRALEDYLKKA